MRRRFNANLDVNPISLLCVISSPLCVYYTTNLFNQQVNLQQKIKPIKIYAKH